MKTKRMICFKLCLVAFIIMSLFCIACDDIVDYNDGYTSAEQLANTDVPTIKAVYAVEDTAMTTPITEGELGQTVRIVGANLNNVKSIKFNTVDVDLANIYTAGSFAIVQIPSTLSLERVNQIEYTTDRGTALFDFLIPFPDLQITGLLNEFAGGGDVATIIGTNFDLYGFDSGVSEVTLAGDKVEVGKISSGSMEIQLPENLSDNETLTVRWLTAAGEEQTKQLPLRPVSHLLFADLSAVQRDKTHEAVTVDDNGRSIHVQGHFSAWSWIELSFSQNLPDIGVDITDVDNLNFVFEAQNQGQYPFAVAGYKFGWNWSEWDNCHWQPGDGAGLNTFGEWQTIRIPLSSLAPNGLGEVGQWFTLNVLFQPVADYDANYKIANFRIQNK